MIESEVMSMPPVTPGKLYVRIGSSDFAATCFTQVKRGLTVNVQNAKGI